MTKTIALVTKVLLQWADWAGGYVQFTLFPSAMDYLEVDICQYPNTDHTYFRGAVDEVMKEMDAHLRAMAGSVDGQEIENP